MKTDVLYKSSANRIKTMFVSDMKMKFAMLLSKIRKFFLSDTNMDLKVILLKYKLKRLEGQSHVADTKKIELEKLLSDFQYRHNMELGELLLEILKLRIQLFQADQSKQEDAKNDEEQFREQVLADRKRQKHAITKDEQKELKKKFRKATVLCHPDKVDEKYSAEASEIFISLKDAYDANNLKKVADILFNLEKGNYFKPKSETVSEAKLLIAQIIKLRVQIKSMEKDVVQIKKSFDYKKIIAIADWDEYFKNMKTKLEAELKEMKMQLLFEER